MMKNTFLALLLPTTIWGIACTPKTDSAPAVDAAGVLTQFIRQNPGRATAYFVRNDSVLADVRGTQKMPLASTVKIIIAIEFARQAAAGAINPDERVPVSDLDLYYIPNTDGNAHPAWKNAATAANVLTNNRVSLLEVAKGMIRFSSNANTEYLLDRLGSEAVNATIARLGLTQHDRIIPIASTLFLFSTSDKAALVKKMQTLSPADYEKETVAIHEQLKRDADGSFKKRFIFPDMALQKLWSDRLAGSTAKDYASLLQKINRRTYFPAAEQTYLDQIMEWPFVQTPDLMTRYKHLGGKGGSTAFVLTYALYTTDNAGNRTEIVTFFNNLTTDECKQLSSNLNAFQGKATQSATARTLAAELMK